MEETDYAGYTKERIYIRVLLSWYFICKTTEKEISTLLGFQP
jgi:hypothetical protein